MDDYSQYPESLTERRSETAAEWTPRDVLIKMLRDVDSGEFPHLDCIVVSYREKDPTDSKGTTSSGYMAAGPDVQTTLGLLQSTILKVWKIE